MREYGIRLKVYQRSRRGTVATNYTAMIYEVGTASLLIRFLIGASVSRLDVSGGASRFGFSAGIHQDLSISKVSSLCGVLYTINIYWRPHTYSLQNSERWDKVLQGGTKEVPGFVYSSSIHQPWIRDSKYAAEAWRFSASS